MYAKKKQELVPNANNAQLWNFKLHFQRLDTEIACKSMNP